ncbi:hypothetical protein QE152_g6830 [Popillia japonica]|uniref:Uncharacterized protein n=1 Tax=Popillia japonica TaxID=7064 RepID=A0AAW1MGR9_POPJA
MVQIKNIKDGGVIIKCRNKEDSSKIKDAAEKKLKKKYDIKVPRLLNPCIKILDIEENMEENELIACIKKQNPFIQHENFTITVKALKKMKTKSMSIIEVDPVTYTKIISEGKLSIGWNICRVFEYVNVFHHETDACASDSWKCINCLDANQDLKLDFALNHSPFDISCPCLKRKIELQKRKINYDISCPCLKRKIELQKRKINYKIDFA